MSATTIGVNGKLAVPGWNFSPVAILGFSSISMTVTGTGDLSSVGGLTGSGTSLVYGGGFDWQGSGGVTFGADYKILSSTSGGLPGIHLGYFF